MLDLLEESVGPIVDVYRVGDPTRWTELTRVHESGAVSQASLSITTPIKPEIAWIDLYGPTGSLTLDTTRNAEDFGAAMAAIPAEFAVAVASGEGHALDARRGLHLQQRMATALADHAD